MVKAILEKCEGLAVDERRTVRDDYVEVVAFTRDMAEWDRRIAGVLGPAAKPAGQKPQVRHEALAATYGGIQAGQTLYCKEDGGAAEVVLVWPWRDGEHMTLKMARVEQAAPPPAAEGSRRGLPVVAWVGIAAAAALVVAVVAFAVAVRRLDARLRATVVQNVDLAQVADGAYEGVCDLGLVSARVRVTVDGGRIAGIRMLKHSHGPGYGAAKVADAVVAAQTLQVDAVAGATGSSTVVRKAIENALRQGLSP